VNAAIDFQLQPLYNALNWSNRQIMKNPGRHLGLYGTVALPKGHCPNCDLTSFIIDNKYQCCDTYAAITSYDKRIRYSIQLRSRKKPSSVHQHEQLVRQEFLCFYCGLGLKEPHYNQRKNKFVYIFIHWDHFIPYSFMKDNKDINFVASCSICNLIKSNKIFDSPEEARKYVIKKRKQKGFKDFKDLPELFGTILHNQEQQNLLRSKMQVSSMGKEESFSRMGEKERENRKTLEFIEKILREMEEYFEKLLEEEKRNETS
jgi:5-methylcytosine-specific restriction endonuclease McrA